MKQSENIRYMTRRLVFVCQLASSVFGVALADDFELMAQGTIVQYQQGNYAQALNNAQLAVQQANTRHDDALLTNALNNLAAVQSINNDAVAEQTYQQALVLAKSTYGESSLAVATILNNLGSLYKGRDDINKAQDYYQRALLIRETKMGKEWIEVAESLNNLASTYRYQKQFAQAASAYGRALDIQQKQLGDTHPEVAVTLNNLATLNHVQNQLDQAAPLYRRAIVIMKQYANTSPLDTAKVMFNYAMLLKSQQQWGESEEVLLQAGPIFDAKLGKQDAMSMKTLEQLADIYMKTGRNEKANEYFTVIAQRKG